MKYSYQTIIILTLILSVSITLFGQEKRKTLVPGTRVNLVLTPNYRTVEASGIIMRITNDAALIIKEVPQSFEQLKLNYSTSNELLDQNVLRIGTPKDLIINGLNAWRIGLYRSSGLFKEENVLMQLFVIGDSSESIIATAAYSDTSSDAIRDELISIVETIIWDRKKALDPMDIYRFTIDTSKELQSFKKSDKLTIYTSNGEKPDSTGADPFYLLQVFNIPQSNFLPDYEIKKMMESYIYNTFSYIRPLRVVEFTEDTLAGIRLFETISTGNDIRTNLPTAAYFTVFLHPLNMIGFSGFPGTKEYDKYVEIFKSLVRTFKRKKITMKEFADCYPLLEQKKYNLAQQCYDENLKLNPASLTARLGKAESLRLLGKYKEALAEFDNVINLDGTADEAFIGRGRVNVALKKFYDAERDFDRVVQLNSNDGMAFAERAMVKAESGNPYGAAKDFDKAVSLQGNSAELFLMNGDAKIKMGDYTDAVKSYSSAILLDSKNSEAYGKRGRANMEMHHYTEALSDLNKALGMIPPQNYLYSLRAKVYMMTGKYENSLSDLEKALQFKPKDDGLKILKGRCYGYSGKLDDAVKELSAIIKADDQNMEAKFSRGAFLLFKGKYEDAGNDIRNALQYYANVKTRIWLYACEFKKFGLTSAKANLQRYYSNFSQSKGSMENILLRFALGELTDPQFISEIEKSIKNSSYDSPVDKKRKLADAYFIAGLLKYTYGSKYGAKQFWGKCLEYKIYESEEYHIANASISGLLK